MVLLDRRTRSSWHSGSPYRFETEGRYRSSRMPERKRGARGRPLKLTAGGSLVRVIHLVFDRVRRVLEADHVLHLEVDVGVDEVLVEHAALQEIVVVGVKRSERFAQRAADGQNLLQLGRRQIVQVLVHRRAGIELVLDTVEA